MKTLIFRIALWSSAVLALAAVAGCIAHGPG